MALMLPAWLGEALNYLGFNWPISNEDVLSEWAREFEETARSGRSLESDFLTALEHVKSNNEGPALSNFVQAVSTGDSNYEALRSFNEACDGAAVVCRVSSGIVVVLKGVFIAQLIVMAASLASGPGALVVREAVRRVINAAIDYAADQVLNEALG
ncbi:hypothetical protein [Tessaracoccus sp. OH4464_COT-324]|uniref:WXG100-like domain-containing protein n=1 Tax=Tessaracoccus sp. OH4464_COT-324 TaxID=2491059 RepID=UPI000F63B44B|nr:hypothetical protein [Tessaracoccus sp. OH4464_COT-324]RRD47210.1 hypothetical protein EII42_04305 [Tessaracoccus sp. OH4464_COT-324]